MGSIESSERHVDDRLIKQLEKGDIEEFERIRQSVSKWYHIRMRSGIRLTQSTFAHLFSHRRLITLLDNNGCSRGEQYTVGHNYFAKWDCQYMSCYWFLVLFLGSQKPMDQPNNYPNCRGPISRRFHCVYRIWVFSNQSYDHFIYFPSMNR